MPRTAGRRFRRALFSSLAAGLAALAGLAGSEAHAWYFPEHAVLTEEGLRYLPEGARKALEEGLARARACDDKLVLSPSLGERFVTTFAVPEDDAIPYVALPALAGDHSSTVTQLQDLVTRGKKERLARALLIGARLQWVDFLRKVKAADTHQASAVDAVDRADLVRDLDVYLGLKDSQYVRRSKQSASHFQEAGESLTWLLQGLVDQGRVDNALGQFVVHHLRSLELAVGVRKASADHRNERTLEAYLEHAFALHFLQDAFAAGHAIMTEKYRADPDGRRRRHDFFDHSGLFVTWALHRGTCATERVRACPALGAGPDAECPPALGLASCWQTYGDGFLGDSDRPDRLHVTEAVARVQIQLAAALDPTWAEALATPPAAVPTAPPVEPAWPGQRAGTPLALTVALVDPFPQWSLAPVRRAAAGPPPPARGPQIVGGLLRALAQLTGAEARGATRVRHVEANSNRPTPVAVPRRWIGAPLRDFDTDPLLQSSCAPRTQGACPLGDIDISIVRPVLAVWPLAVVPPDSQPGEDAFQTGPGIQFWGSIVTAFHTSKPYGLVPSVAAGFGLSYRAENLFPARPNASIVEASVGIFGAANLPIGDWQKVPPTGHGGILGELRFPAISTSFWQLLSLFTNRCGDCAAIINPLPAGGRIFLDLTRLDRPKIDGFDIEGVSFVLPIAKDTRGAQRVSLLPTEIRTRAGYWFPTNAVTFSLELTGGISHVFGQ